VMINARNAHSALGTALHTSPYPGGQAILWILFKSKFLDLRIASLMDGI
jgi:hypothetical protein